MPIILTWIIAIIIGLGVLCSLSYVENGYQDALIAADSLNEAIIQAQVDRGLNHPERYRLIAESQLSTEVQGN